MDITGIAFYLTLCFLIIFCFAVIFAEVLGRLWVWIGTIAGTIWLILQSSYLTDLIGSAADILDKINAFLAPQPPGPLTLLIRNAVSPFLTDIVTGYVNLFEGLIFTMELSTGDMAEVVVILKLCGLSIIVPLLAAVYVNAELLLVLIIVNTAWRIWRKPVRKQRKEEKKQRKAEKKQSAEKDNGERTPETGTVRAAEISADSEDPLF